MWQAKIPTFEDECRVVLVFVQIVPDGKEKGSRTQTAIGIIYLKRNVAMIFNKSFEFNKGENRILYQCCANRGSQILPA